jgi:hypothetical protein
VVIASDSPYSPEEDPRLSILGQRMTRFLPLHLADDILFQCWPGDQQNLPAIVQLARLGVRPMYNMVFI